MAIVRWVRPKNAVLIVLSISIFLFCFLIPGIRVATLSRPEKGTLFQTSFMKIRARELSRSAPYHSSWVPIEEISPLFLCAVVKAEDHLFFSHQGFDWSQLLKAMVLYSTSEHSLGGSTITEQLARNLFLSSKRSWLRKINEAIYTVWLETLLTKKEILTLYLNGIELGNEAWGIGAAAASYLHSRPNEIGLEDGILLATLIAAPRVPAEKQLKRIETDYERINHQLYFSGLYSFERWAKAQRRWTDVKQILQSQGGITHLTPNRWRGPEDNFLKDDPFTNQCGLKTEIKNSQLRRIASAFPGPESKNPDLRKIVQSGLMSSSIFPIHLSPDGTKILLKEFLPASFKLILRELKTGRTLAVDESKDPQTAPTWRPDGNAVAFARLDREDLKYHLYLLETQTGRQVEIKAPSSANAPPILWSSDGSHLLYARWIADNPRRELVVIQLKSPSTAERVAYFPISKNSGVSWSPDGSRIGAIEEGKEGIVSVWSLQGKKLNSFKFSDGECRGVRFSESGEHVFGICRGVADEFFSIYRGEIATSRTESYLKVEGDISGPMPLPDRSGIAYHLTRAGETTVWVKRKDSPSYAIGPRDGVSGISSFSPDGKWARIIYNGRTTPPRILEVPISGGEGLTVFSSGPDAPKSTAATDVAIPLPEGHTVPAFLWRSKKNGGPGAAILMLHGGPTAVSPPIWAATKQFLTSHGIHVLALNFSGSTSYGQAFENSGSELKWKDEVLSARNYLTRKLGVPPERIVLFGHSFGATLAAQLLREFPELFKIGVILSLTHLAPGQSHTYAGKLLSVQGALDASLSPEEAFSQLSSILSLSSQPQDATFRLLSDEGHSFGRIESWTEVYEWIFEALNLSESRGPHLTKFRPSESLQKSELDHDK